MPIGPGKYDDVCTEARRKTGGGVVLIVTEEGIHGPGFSAQLTVEQIRRLPSVLRQIASEMERVGLEGPRG